MLLLLTSTVHGLSQLTTLTSFRARLLVVMVAVIDVMRLLSGQRRRHSRVALLTSAAVLPVSSTWLLLLLMVAPLITTSVVAITSNTSTFRCHRHRQLRFVVAGARRASLVVSAASCRRKLWLLTTPTGRVSLSIGHDSPRLLLLLIGMTAAAGAAVVRPGPLWAFHLSRASVRPVCCSCSVVSIALRPVLIELLLLFSRRCCSNTRRVLGRLFRLG